MLRRLCSAASAQTTAPTHHLVRSGYKTALIQRWLAKRPRYHLHFTPKGASWINLVSLGHWLTGFSALNRKTSG